MELACIDLQRLICYKPQTNKHELVAAYEYVIAGEYLLIWDRAFTVRCTNLKDDPWEGNQDSSITEDTFKYLLQDYR